MNLSPVRQASRALKKKRRLCVLIRVKENTKINPNSAALFLPRSGKFMLNVTSVIFSLQLIHFYQRNFIRPALADTAKFDSTHVNALKLSQNFFFFATVFSLVCPVQIG